MEELEIAVVRIENEVSTNYGTRQGFLSKNIGGGRLPLTKANLPI